MSNVFLSHSHADKPFARKLAEGLKVAGHGVWIDEAEIDIGDSLIEKIRDGIDQVDYVAAILSTASIGSAWVTRELDIASNREIEEKRVLVLPILVESVDLPGFLKGKFYGDFTDDTRFDEMLDLLLRKLGRSQKPDGSEADDFKIKDSYSKNTLILFLQRNISGEYTSDELDKIYDFVEAEVLLEPERFNRHVLREIVKECLECKETAYTIVNKHWYALCE